MKLLKLRIIPLSTGINMNIKNALYATMKIPLLLTWHLLMATMIMIVPPLAQCRALKRKPVRLTVAARLNEAVIKAGHKIENPTVTKAATCTEAGEEKGKCSVWKEVTQTVPALGHTFSDVTETLDNTAVDGHTYVVKTCTVCNQKESTPTHVAWVEGQYTSTVVTKPSCTISGLQIDTCKSLVKKLKKRNSSC